MLIQACLNGSRVPGEHPSQHFGSPAAVMCASAAELGRAPGIGKKSAERIWRATHTELAREHNA